MEPIASRIRDSLLAFAFIIALVCGQLSLRANDGEEHARVVMIKPRIETRGSVVKMKDMLLNPDLLQEEEKELEIMDTPIRADKSLSLLELACLMQKHPQLHELSIRGPSSVVVQRGSNSEALDKAKQAIIAYLKENAPWKDWEVDVMFSPSDEHLISRVEPFKRVEVFPYDNKGMLGTVALSVAFFNEFDRQVSKQTISPVILKKVYVSVMNSQVKQGRVLNGSELKKVPMWLGADKRDYITDEKDCLGKELAKSMSPGDILKAGDLLNPVCAKQGETVWVECRSGALSVKLAVTAMEAGRKGDMVTVKNQSTQKTFKVEMIGERQAVYRI
ncbi:MAG: flagella basal body P-ring formation protein FlgA [Lentisphaerae bacterium GWF2_52_8]|nr:MAG: flagella basal body P-ring formation protein FlgA [Lentisphaerae bacterium GWF2_52_8]